MTPLETTAAIESARVVAILRFEDAARVVPVARALVQGGIRAIEVTLTTPRAIELIGELKRELPESVLVGAGTVVAVRAVAAIAAAGATFIVSPIFNQELILAAHEHNLAALPGCFSPTEIFDAWSGGADLVKVFPAAPLGPSFVRDVRGPFPDLKLVPTGGVSLENAKDWLRAGASAVGIGGALVEGSTTDAPGVATLTARARRLLADLPRYAGMSSTSR